MSTRSLLVELLVEELPPKALEKLGEAFSAGIGAGLDEANLIGEGVTAKRQWFASPRRLAVLVPNVLGKAEDQSDTRKLVPVSVGYDKDGGRTPALIKKLASLGLKADTPVYPMPDGKADALVVDLHVAGATLAEGLQKALDKALAKLPIPKVMSYQLADGWTSVNFVRPVHGLVALHGDDVVPVTALGLQAQRSTHGHRFEATASPIVLRSADSYARQLQDEGAVIPGFAERRAEIARQLQAAATALGLRPIDDDALLDEVTGLVERPNVLACQFEAQFLDVPSECLILTMKANQKYFPLLDGQRKLTNKFLVVSNIRPGDPSRVIEGNQRVVRPRLADAKFFFDQDRKKTLESRLPLLDKVVYHGKLGSQGERIQRVRAIARAIGEQLGGAALAAQADRAALLAKADLVSDMVGEFPELQGVMGGYYARHDGESDAVAFAIEDHYKPRFAGDALARNEVGVVVALADKLETLIGMFDIEQLPTGDKDPFALRRHALGVLRMLVERSLPLEVSRLLHDAGIAFGNRYERGADVIGEGVGAADLKVGRRPRPETLPKIEQFLYDRLSGSLRDHGYSAHEVDAVLSLRPQRLAEVPKRLAAVRAFTALAEAASLAAANKRVANILKKASDPVRADVDVWRLTEPAEIELHAAVARVRPLADAQFERGDHAASLQALAALKAPVDAFFEAVMVNADDPALRANRLALLASLHAAMNRVADLSRLAS